SHAHTLVNTGVISGGSAGVSDGSQFAGAVIDNAGSIVSDGDTIDIWTKPGLTTFITNAATGLIKSTDTAVGSLAGKFVLDNAGTIIGVIVDVAGEADIVKNHGAIQGKVELGGGNDRFVGTGGTAGDVFGDAGNDRLIGGGQVDFLHGGR